MGKRSRGWFKICGNRSLSNVAPTASGVQPTGSSEVGETLTCVYTYNDVNGDEQGATTFQWYQYDDEDGTNETAIVGETSETYTVLVGDLGLWLGCTVTPKALTGVLVGDPVKSSKRQIPEGYYVKVGGSDVAAGTSDATAWATISKLNTEIAAGNIDMPVYLNRGDTWNEAVDFDENDDISIGAYGSGADPVLTGLTTLGDSWSDQGGNIWRYDISGITSNSIRYLKSNSVDCVMATTASGACDTAISTISFQGDITGSLGDYNDAECVARTAVTGYRWENKNMSTFAADGTVVLSAANGYSLYPDYGYFFQNNVLILTDNATQDEWVHVGSYVYMYSTTDPYDLTGDVEVATIDKLIDIDNCSNVVIEDIKLEYSNSFGIWQETYSKDNISINNCVFDHVVRPIRFNGAYLTNFSCDGCTFTDTGSEAIYLFIPNDPQITNITMTDVGLVLGKSHWDDTWDATRYYGHNGITLATPTAGLIQYVNIEGVAGRGISIEAPYSDTSIDSCYVKNAMRYLTDGGAFYIVSASSDAAKGAVVTNCIAYNEWADFHGMEGMPINASIAGFYKDNLLNNVRFDNCFSWDFTPAFMVNSCDGLEITNSIGVNFRVLYTYLGFLNGRGYGLRINDTGGGYNINSTITDNVFMVNKYTGQSVYSYDINVEDTDILGSAANNEFDHNKLLAPVSTGENPYPLRLATVAKSLEEYKAYDAVGEHEQKDLMIDDHTGLTDPEEIVYPIINPTTTPVISASFPAGYRYYTVDGDIVTIDTLGPYEGKIYLRTIDEGMPQASGIYITGSYAVGQVLTGHYTFTHEEGDGEDGSTFQWYTSDDYTSSGREEISGATGTIGVDSPVYTLTSSEFNKYIVFGITPRSDGSVGTLTTGVERFFVTASKVF